MSPEELLQAHLERITHLNERLNAYIFVNEDGARLEARAMPRRMKTDDLPLAGLPISIKSSISVAGFPWECGSRLRSGLRGGSDAPLVSRLRRAGAVLLGATNVPEFLMSWETDNAIYGRTNSPWDIDRTPGGSSGGESAAIASGMSAGGIGSDGGGSIRVPAHFTGICGLKPTPGRIPTTGHFPASAGPFASLGVVGPMARTVADVSLLYRVIAGPDDGDPCAAPVPVTSVKKKLLRNLRIGYFEDDGSTPVAPEIRTALLRARTALEDQGFRVEEFRPTRLGETHRLWWNLFGRAVGILLAPMFRDRESDMSPTLKQWNSYLDSSPPLSRDDLMETLLQRDSVRTCLLREMEAFPILLCPVAAVGPFRHGEREWSIEGQVVRYLDAWKYAAWFNLTGSPAISIPVPGVSRYPTGVQLVGRPWADDAVLGVAALLEEAVGAHPAPDMD